MGFQNGWSCEVHQNARVAYVGLGAGCPMCKAENENMLLKKEITALKEQNDWYATKYDDHKCLENFLDEVFDNAYECTIDKPWREVFEDYCVFNMNKSKEAE